MCLHIYNYMLINKNTACVACLKMAAINTCAYCTQSFSTEEWSLFCSPLEFGLVYVFFININSEINVDDFQGQVSRSLSASI
jgi:hypothetical protein